MSKIKLILFVASLCLTTACMRDKILYNIELEQAVLNQCSLMNQTLVNEFSITIDKDKYVSSCGCVSSIITNSMCEDRTILQIEKLTHTPQELKKTILEYMRKDKERIRVSCGNQN